MTMKAEQVKIVISFILLFVLGDLLSQQKKCYFLIEEETNEYSLIKKINKDRNVIEFFLNDKKNKQKKGEQFEYFSANSTNIEEYLYNPIGFLITSMITYDELYKILGNKYCKESFFIYKEENLYTIYPVKMILAIE